MISRKDLMILSHLRANGRESLTGISKKTQVPITTIFDRLKQYEGKIIRKHAALVNFFELGFTINAHVLIKADSSSRNNLRDYLARHPNINSLCKVGNGFDFLFEAVFLNINMMEDFMAELDNKYPIQNKEVYYVVEDIKKESFLSDASLLDLVMKNEP